MSKTALFVGNGTIEDYDKIAAKILSNYDYIIALDGGIKNCHKLKLIPSLIIGDMDSAQKNEITGFTVIKKNTQDLTDFEFAVDYCFSNLNIATIDAIAVTSLSRIDHSLLNIYQPIARLQSDINITIITENNILKAVGSGKHKIVTVKNQTVSLVVLTKTFINSTENLKWNLTNYQPEQPWFGVSNIAEEKAFYIDIEYGSVMIIMVDQA